jgi:hypothetical protein
MQTRSDDQDFSQSDNEGVDVFESFMDELFPEHPLPHFIDEKASPDVDMPDAPSPAFVPYEYESSLAAFGWQAEVESEMNPTLHFFPSLANEGEKINLDTSEDLLGKKSKSSSTDEASSTNIIQKKLSGQKRKLHEIQNEGERKETTEDKRKKKVARLEDEIKRLEPENHTLKGELQALSKETLALETQRNQLRTVMHWRFRTLYPSQQHLVKSGPVEKTAEAAEYAPSGSPKKKF